MTWVSGVGGLILSYLSALLLGLEVMVVIGRSDGLDVLSAALRFALRPRLLCLCFVPNFPLICGLLLFLTTTDGSPVLKPKQEEFPDDLDDLLVSIRRRERDEKIGLFGSFEMGVFRPFKSIRVEYVITDVCYP